MRIPAPTYVRTLLHRAAKLRAAGNTWETIALKVHRSVRTLHHWMERYATDWGRLYRAAENKQLEEASLEAYLHLRQLLRSEDTRVIERVSRFLYDRRCRVAREQDKADAATQDPDDDRYGKWYPFIDYLESLTDEQRQALEKELAGKLVAALPAPADDGSGAGPAVAE